MSGGFQKFVFGKDGPAGVGYVVIAFSLGVLAASFVGEILMPPIRMLLGKVDLSNLFVVIRDGNPPSPYKTLALAQDAGAITINYGKFLYALIVFLLVALVVYILVKLFSGFKRAK